MVNVNNAVEDRLTHFTDAHDEATIFLFRSEQPIIDSSETNGIALSYRKMTDE